MFDENNNTEKKHKVTRHMIRKKKLSKFHKKKKKLEAPVGKHDQVGSNPNRC